VPLAF